MPTRTSAFTTKYAESKEDGSDVLYKNNAFYGNHLNVEPASDNSVYIYQYVPNAYIASMSLQSKILLLKASKLRMTWLFSVLRAKSLLKARLLQMFTTQRVLLLQLARATSTALPDSTS